MKLTVPALVRVPTVWAAVPVNVAVPVPLTVKSIADLKSTAVSFVSVATVILEVFLRAPARAARVPALTVVAPVYVLAPESVNVSAPILLSAPAPEIIPPKVPPVIETAPLAIVILPPLRVVMVADDFAFKVPDDMVVTVAAPVEVTAAPERVAMLVVPVIFKVPAEAVPLTVRLPPKELVPAPAKLVAVIA